MKSKIVIYTAFVLISLLSSCEKTIDFNGKVPDPQLVMNCIALPDSTITVNLTKSKFFLSSSQDFTTVDNAIVTATINDTLKVNLTNTGNGNYVSGIIPKPNDKVRIDASAPSLESVWAEVNVQPKMTIISIDTTWVKIDNSYSYPIYNLTGDSIIGNAYNAEVKIKIKFQDNATEQNYYRLNVSNGLNYRSGYSSYGSGYSGVEFDDIVFGNTTQQGSILDIVSGTYGNNCFTDELINGKEYSLSIKSTTTHNIYLPGKKAGGDIVSKNELIIDLQQLSKSYYLYIKTKDASMASNPLFSEAVQIYTNIKGGMGILGTYTSSNVVKIEL